jgi:hypothetical protein
MSTKPAVKAVREKNAGAGSGPAVLHRLSLHELVYALPVPRRSTVVTKAMVNRAKKVVCRVMEVAAAAGAVYLPGAEPCADLTGAVEATIVGVYNLATQFVRPRRKMSSPRARDTLHTNQRRGARRTPAPR